MRAAWKQADLAGESPLLAPTGPGEGDEETRGCPLTEGKARERQSPQAQRLQQVGGQDFLEAVEHKKTRS
jgi:hypothetical protein